MAIKQFVIILPMVIVMVLFSRQVSGKFLPESYMRTYNMLDDNYNTDDFNANKKYYYETSENRLDNPPPYYHSDVVYPNQINPVESVESAEMDRRNMISDALFLDRLATTERLQERNNLKKIAQKKDGSKYYMGLCHFKICNIAGRKRTARNVHTPDLYHGVQPISKHQRTN